MRMNDKTLVSNIYNAFKYLDEEHAKSGATGYAFRNDLSNDCVKPLHLKGGIWVLLVVSPNGNFMGFKGSID